MKKIFSLILVIILISWGCSKKKETKLTFSIFFPATHAQAKAAKAFAEEIEKRTNGKIKIATFPGGTLTKANQVYDGVVKGISDMGLSCFAYTRGRFPVMAALDLPVGYPNGIVASKVANEFAKSTQPKELSDVKVLYVHAHGPGLLHTKKKIEKLEDLKSVKIRATGLSTKIVNALGGLPVAMPQGGTYEALQKGVVDGTLGPIEALNGWKQGEVINYTTDCRNIGYTTSMFVVMNKKKWNALPDDIKKVFNEVSEEWVGVHGKAWDVADEAGKNFTLKRGNEIIELTADEKIKWENAVAPIIQSYIEKTPDGKKYVDFIKDCIKKYSK